MVDVHDLAIVGAGAAGTFVADAASAARPEWSIALYERTSRIGGRLRSVAVPGLEHRIELGGMRYLTSHRLVDGVVGDLGIPTRPFDTTDGTERSYLRGHFGTGFDDPAAGIGYDLPAAERGRTGADLAAEAFDRIVPGFAALSTDGWVHVRANARYGSRRLVDWSIGEALGTVLSEAGRAFVTDLLAYDSGPRAFNVGDAIEYFFGRGDPTAEARVPNDGMDRIPRALADRFVTRGGSIRLDRHLVSINDEGGTLELAFADGTCVRARQVVLAVPIPALRSIVEASRTLARPAFDHVLSAVEGFQAAKVYLWYERPWWKEVVSGIRTITDLPARKVFYFDEDPDGPAALLATYTDGRHTDAWRDLAGLASDGQPAPEAVRAVLDRQLAILHQGVPHIPVPLGSAIQRWGADAMETGWTFWRPGVISDDVMKVAPQPDPSIPVFVAGEAFSRAQAWVEGALETAAAVLERLLNR